MATAIITPVAPVVSLDAAREALVLGVVKTGDLIATYAGALNVAFNLTDNTGAVTTAWYDLKGKLAAPVKAERAKFVEAFVQRGFEKPTIDVYWQRVKVAAGKVYTQNRVAGANDPAALCLSDLKTILNRIFKMEEDGVETDWSDEKAFLMDVYSRMGGDVDKIG